MISVIIPVYNVEKYLEQSIKSVIGQSYKNLDVILVDDGSEDRSGIICDRFAQQDNRITVIHKKNSGLSDARNVGTELAKGKYVFYLDSDDYLEKDALERIYNLAETNACDVVTSNFFYTYSDYEKIANENKQDYEILDTRSAVMELVKGNIIQNFAWGKLISAEIAKRNNFPSGKLFEDFFWTHHIIDEAKKVAVDFKPSVHYRQRDNSISYHFKLKNLDQLEGMMERKAFLELSYPEFSCEYDKVMVQNGLSMCWSVVRYLKGNEKKEATVRLRNFFSKIDLSVQNSIPEANKRKIQAFQKSVLQYEWLVLKERVVSKEK